eukprot:3903392-Prymnesium_polylepis.1
MPKLSCSSCSRRPPPAMREGLSPEAADRALASAVYLLPFLDGFQYGAYVYSTVPGLGPIAYSFVPLVNTFQSIPFAGLILFFSLSYFARSTNLSRFVRFNIQQAILLDIVMIVSRTRQS